MAGQAPRHVVLIRPHRFRPNPLTAADNAFQHPLPGAPAEVASRARAEVDGAEGPSLMMSATAAAQLTAAQRRRLERWCRIVPAAVPTIEAAGGSVRCMLAGVHLPAAREEGSTLCPRAEGAVPSAQV